MIRRLMEQFGIDDPQRVAKVGDTPVDLQEGQSAGCGLVVGVTGDPVTPYKWSESLADQLPETVEPIVYATAAHPLGTDESGNLAACPVCPNSRTRPVDVSEPDRLKITNCVVYPSPDAKCGKYIVPGEPDTVSSAGLVVVIRKSARSL